MAVLEINYKNFISGEGSADFVSDRGFSSDSYGLNLTKKRGVLDFIDGGTQIGSAVLTDDIIAGCYDDTYLGNDLHFLDASGSFYTLSGTTLTKRQTSASTFTEGTSDIFQFNGYTYATSTDSLHQLTGSDLTNCERLWGASLNATYRHPIERVENEMFVADGNVIYYLDNAGSTGTAFTLPTGQAITTLRKHIDGTTLLAFTGDSLSNYSHTKGSGGMVYYCNPNLRDWVREVPIEAQVEGTRVVGGIIYVTYGNNFGYFDGSGLQPLKRLDTSTTTYSHAINNQEDNLLVRDGRFGLILGDLGAGNVWWKNFRNSATNNLTTLFYQGDNKILFATSDSKLYQVDYDNSGSSGIFYTNRYFPGEEIKITRIEIVHANTTSTQTTSIEVDYINSDDTSTPVYNRSYNGSGDTGNKERIETSIITDIYKFAVFYGSDPKSISLIRIHYETV